MNKNTGERSQIRQIYGEVYYVHGLEASKLLRIPFSLQLICRVNAMSFRVQAGILG